MSNNQPLWLPCKRHIKTRFTCFMMLVWMGFTVVSQTNEISIKGALNTISNTLQIQQEIIFYNSSKDTLFNVYLHNWANSFENNKTPLSKRLIEDFDKSLHFAKEKDLGFSKIYNLTVNADRVVYENIENQSDILKIHLNAPLNPTDTIKIMATYSVKIPNAKFTGYGLTNTDYHLRFWYLSPAVYNGTWQLMSNLNLDDLYEYSSSFKIELEIPHPYHLESNLYQYITDNQHGKTYFLVGKNKTDIILNIQKQKTFASFQTKNIQVYTDLLDNKLDDHLSSDILNRELLFLEEHLGKYPHKQIFIDQITQQKNPIYGLNQLPNILRPFSDVFKWDITLFKEISKKYIESTLLLNKREDYWLLDGIQTYLMMEYVETYYPNVNLLGKVANLWGIRSFNFSKLKFNDKYPFVYQFTTRQFLDQRLTTRADSLSNFNRKIFNKYKAGLGFRYLNDYLGEHILNTTIKEFYLKSHFKISSSLLFEEILSSKTSKNLDWFFVDYIQTNKKIDYTIKNAIVRDHFIDVTIKNKRNTKAPIVLYGLKKDEVVFKKWITNVDSVKTVTIPKGDFSRLILNYEQLYPEYNFLNNSKNLKNKFFNKPLKFTFLKDIESPNYHQVFYQPEVKYNYYNGVIFGINLHNKPIIEKNLELQINPSYAFKSNSVIGNFSFLYKHFFENSKLYNIKYGLFGGTSDYAPNLSYASLIPYVAFNFNRETLRDVGNKVVAAKLVHINKDIPVGGIRSSSDQYSVFNLFYSYNKPDIIKGVSYRFSTEFAKNFSKLSSTISYRQLSTSDTNLEFRLFAGVFLKNETTDDYFSFGLDRPSDYLFELNYIGRSESSGILSQQLVVAEGGFKSVLPTRFANQFLVSFNSSIGVWRWAEFYNDVAFLKNRNTRVYFGYENGMRFNFIDTIFEVYFPFYSNNGWEINQQGYAEKVRFVFTANFNSIYNFFRRGFL